MLDERKLSKVVIGVRRMQTKIVVLILRLNESLCYVGISLMLFAISDGMGKNKKDDCGEAAAAFHSKPLEDSGL